MTAMPKQRTMRARSQHGLDLARRPAAVQLEAERLTHDDRVRLALAHHEEVGVALRFDREDLAAAPREVGARQCKEAQGRCKGGAREVQGRCEGGVREV